MRNLKIHKSHVILYVENQSESCLFYSKLLCLEPHLNVPGMTEFYLSDSLVLGLMPNNSIEKIINGKLPHPSLGNGIPRCELYLYVENIDEIYQHCKSLHLNIFSDLEERTWGDKAFYFTDLDGHVLAFAEKM